MDLFYLKQVWMTQVLLTSSNKVLLEPNRTNTQDVSRVTKTHTFVPYSTLTVKTTVEFEVLFWSS